MAKAMLTWTYKMYDGPHPALHTAEGVSFEAATKEMKDGTGIAPIFVKKEWARVCWPGLYPLYYMTKDGGCLCPECANENIAATLSDDPQWQIEEVDANMERTDLWCDNCYKTIPNAADIPTSDGEENDDD